LDDETCWTQFLSIADYFKQQINECSDQVALVRSFDELTTAWSSSKQAAFLAVEDARLLAGNLQRLDILKHMGVIYLTLLWGGRSCIGGAHDTDEGLTSFGKAVVQGCFDRGILTDVSHASEQSVDDMLELAIASGKPLIATHSNSYSVYAHSRNLRDHHFKAICSMGGFVGVSLCRSHLADITQRNASIEDVIRHIDRYMELGGEHCIGLGCDLDGTDLPYGISNLSDLITLADALSTHGYSDSQIENIFWKNNYMFLQRNLIEKQN
jgi:membrane dipeptidase